VAVFEGAREGRKETKGMAARWKREIREDKYTKGALQNWTFVESIYKTSNSEESYKLEMSISVIKKN
jgi:hypothetical protein